MRLDTKQRTSQCKRDENAMSRNTLDYYRYIIYGAGRTIVSETFTSRIACEREADKYIARDPTNKLKAEVVRIL